MNEDLNARAGALKTRATYASRHSTAARVCEIHARVPRPHFAPPPSPPARKRRAWADM